MEIAVLLATFNRKQKTLICLENLFAQKSLHGVNINVFLTDDNSSDGTAQAIAYAYPQVNLLKGSGALFWAGGMRNSWAKALESNPDFYLLLNDDTVINDDCISNLLKYHRVERRSKEAIVIGSTIDLLKQVISYGGHKLRDPKKVSYDNIFSETEYCQCDLANANIMLVPRQIVEKIGILSDKFTHSMADFDYTLRAKKSGFDVVVVPGIQGLCTDDNLNEQGKIKRNFRQRIRFLKSPKGLAYTEYMGFINTHFPSHKTAVLFKLWFRTIFPEFWQKLKKV
ncbi:glycosyltransferase family 2 protein [Pedobacter sp. MC2016-05]|uniref:glycosyltransferase family 2 protein n=1 Tax=Pedobacter sp. MC2016-05 TaxID=2994474 RepID=UPI0022471F85|nr:glycosyltransferase family 2 protein [Pedobacter sp. MC2016-05]MCX2473263.1 glycosyltransferase family 2 protein [Pedobacter sp. MC2016-05]